MSTTIEQNVAVRKLAQEAIELALMLCLDEKLDGEQTRHYWRCVMEEAAAVINHDPYPKTEVIEAPKKAPLEVEPCDVMPFGKHDGEAMEDIPEGYLHWLADQDWLEERYPEVMAWLEENGYV